MSNPAGGLNQTVIRSWDGEAMSHDREAPPMVPGSSWRSDGLLHRNRHQHLHAGLRPPSRARRRTGKTDASGTSTGGDERPRLRACTSSPERQICAKEVNGSMGWSATLSAGTIPAATCPCSPTAPEQDRKFGRCTARYGSS
jgi:hypothetical protein